jgi:hypothetical protein
MRTVSSKEVLARIIRGKDIPSDMYYHIQEWMAEALAMAYTPATLEIDSVLLNVKNHIASMPCNFYKTICMEYNGYRLLLGTDITAYQKGDTTNIRKAQGNNSYTVFSSITGKMIDIDSLQPCNEYYRESLNCFHFSFEKGDVTLHYNKLATDEEGMPLIPDNENLKQAIYYYCLMQLIGCGVDIKALNFQMCYDFFENKYLPRAINELRDWSPERAFSLWQSQTRMVFPDHLHKDFFKEGEQYQAIKGI